MSEPSAAARPPRTAAALVIGNELLTGKVQEGNVVALARELFGLGVELKRVVFCSDEVDVIVRDLDELRRGHDVVFTSGGVGPTHDDVTVQAVARAFGRPLARSGEIAGLLEEALGDRLTPHHLRMADVPEGAELVTAPTTRWPVLRLANVYVLPGLPEVFRRKLAVVREVCRGGEPFVSRAVTTASDEGTLAPLLRRIAGAFPSLSIGSYPRREDGHQRVVVTFDGRDAREVDRAVAALESALPGDRIVGTSRGA